MPRLPTTNSSPLKRLHWFDDPAVVGYSTNKLITRTANNLGIVFPYCVCSYLLIIALTVSVYCRVYLLGGDWCLLWGSVTVTTLCILCGSLMLTTVYSRGYLRGVLTGVHCYYPPTTVRVIIGGNLSGDLYTNCTGLWWCSCVPKITGYFSYVADR